MNYTGDSAYFNAGLYDIVVLDMLQKPDAVFIDSVLYYKKTKSALSCETSLMKYQKYDLAMLRGSETSNFILNNSKLDDQYKVGYLTMYDSLYYFDPFYYGEHVIPRISKVGMYINCKSINAVWLVKKYISWEEKKASSQLYTNRKWKKLKTDPVYYTKDSTHIVYPIYLIDYNFSLSKD